MLKLLAICSKSLSKQISYDVRVNNTVGRFGLFSLLEWFWLFCNCDCIPIHIR